MHHHLNLSWALKTFPRCSKLQAASRKSTCPALPLLLLLPVLLLLLLPSSSSSSRQLLLQTAADPRRVLGSRQGQTMQQLRQRKRLKSSRICWWRLGRSLLLPAPKAPQLQPVAVALLLLLLLRLVVSQLS